MRFWKFSMVLCALLVFGGVSLFAAEIHEAAEQGDIEAIRAILQIDPGAANETNEEGEVPLHLATYGNHLEIITLLITNGADVNAKNSADQTPLLYAAYFGHREMVELLLTHGATFDYQDTRGNTPIHFAARQGGTAVVELLASKGARIELKDNRGNTPLLLAAGRGHEEIVRFLAVNGADVNARNADGEFPLLAAMRAGSIPAVDFLLQSGAEIDVAGGEAGEMLHLAAAAGSTELVNILVARGAGFDSIDQRGRTMLHSATRGGLVELSKRLIEDGIDVDAVDNAGRTALHYAVDGSHREIVELLLAHNADVEVVGEDGRAPLHIAIDWGRNDLVALLEARGAKEHTRKAYTIGGRKASASEGAEAKRLTISYIGNEGFMIADGSKKVLIDALQRNPWNYLSTSDEIFQMMLNAHPPFDGIDLVAASHGHLDHFEPGMVSNFLSKNETAIFVSSEEAIDQMKEVAGDGYHEFESRVENVTPDWGKTEERTLGGVKAEFFGVDHAGPGRPKVLTLVTVFDLDGIRIAHLADLVAESSEEFFKAAALEERGIDIAFIDPFFLQDSIGRVIIEEHVRPEHIVLMHVRPNEIDRLDEELKELYPDLIIFREPMETKLFIK